MSSCLFIVYRSFYSAPYITFYNGMFSLKRSRAYTLTALFFPTNTKSPTKQPHQWPPGEAFNFNLYSVNVNAMDRSFSCCGSTISGAPDIGSPAFCTFGNAMTSRMESFFSISITMRSRP